jgi:hypothetical protein
MRLKSNSNPLCYFDGRPRLHGGIEPELLGLFATEDDRDTEAIALRKENDEDVILAVDGPAQSVRIEAYGADFLNQQ